MSEKKRKFIQIEKTDYRAKLLEKAHKQGPYAELDDSKLFEKLLENYTRNPALFEDQYIPIRDIELQEQIFLELAKKIDEGNKIIKSFDERLKKIETKLDLNLEEENLFEV